MPVIKTSLGDIKIRLFPEEAPKTVANFLQYVRSGHYRGTIFHRVIDNFMIQGGGLDKQMQQKPTGSPIPCESQNGLSNKKGTLAMARTMEPHSATCQFFINVADNDFLDFTDESEQGWGYAVFGEVVEGMNVVNQIKSVETGVLYGMRDVPLEPVEIIDIVEDDA